MKYKKIAGLCLVALLLMGMATAATASAAPHWEGCVKGASGTKYTTESCETASGTGEWAWGEIKGTEKATITGSLLLEVTEVPLIGTVKVTCSVEGSGSTGPGKFSRTTKITLSCKAGEHCEKLEGTPEALDLPWEEEAFETESSVFIADTHSKSETEGPGWKATCSVLGVKKTIECKAEKGRVVLGTENRFSGSTPRLLVLENWVEDRPVYNSNLSPARGFVSGSTGVLGPPPQPRRLGR